MDDTRSCPYCGETIRVEATICRFCRSRLSGLDPERWHRDHPQRRLAGVTVAVARALAFPLGAVRLGFIVLTFFHLLGPMLYAALWLVVPFRPGEESVLAHALGRLREIVAAFRGARAPDDGDSGGSRCARPGPHSVRVSEGPLT